MSCSVPGLCVSSKPQRDGSLRQGFRHRSRFRSTQSAQQKRSPRLSQWNREHIRGSFFFLRIVRSLFPLCGDPPHVLQSAPGRIALTRLQTQWPPAAVDATVVSPALTAMESGAHPGRFLFRHRRLPPPVPRRSAPCPPAASRRMRGYMTHLPGPGPAGQRRGRPAPPTAPRDLS